MEKLYRNLHLKLQEMCDCYLETDFKTQMAAMTPIVGGDIEEETIKYLALAILYSISEKAGKLKIKKKGGGMKVTVISDEKVELPPPPGEIANGIFEICRAIAHMQEDKGETLLALGLRGSRLELKMKMKKDRDKESLTILFPTA